MCGIAKQQHLVFVRPWKTFYRNERTGGVCKIIVHKRRHQRNEYQERIRRQMREHHSPNEPEARGQAGREQRGESCEQVCAEENRAQRSGIRAEAQIKPVGCEALDHESAGERVEGEEARQSQHDLA